MGRYRSTGLVKKAPYLNTLEIRLPVRRGALTVSFSLENRPTAPAEWAEVIEVLAGLGELRVLMLTFPRRDEVPSDVPSIEAARRVLGGSDLPGEKKLVIRRVNSEPNYSYPLDYDLDKSLSCVEEVF